MLKRLGLQLQRLNGVPLRALIGLDGFVDEIVHAVDRRISPTEYVRIPTLKAYGHRIADAAGLSTNVELATVTRKLGGNGPILALGLKKYRAQVTYIGCVGVGRRVDAFAELADGSRIIGIAEPGHTDAIEFEDGKLIQSKLDELNRMNWERMMAQLTVDEFAGLMDEAQLISLNNWTMLPHMSRIWEHILEEVLPLMKKPLSDKVLFFDLADPEKRTPNDISQALVLIRRFKQAGFNTVLGLNQKEACQIASLLSAPESVSVTSDLQKLTERVADAMHIDCVVIHQVKKAACITKGAYFEVNGPYCCSPILTTGAGDNFNAGFVFAYAMALEPKLCLALGTATSGYYVRNAKSPTPDEMQVFLKQWDSNQLDQSTKEVFP